MVIKQIKYIAVVVWFCCFSLKAQFPNPLDFNTATNATNTGTIPVGSNDLHWTAALTNSLGVYVPAVSCGNQAPGNWINSPFPNANWISFPHTCTPGSPAEHSCIPGHVDVYFKLSFNLPASNCGLSVATPSSYCLSLDFYADNSVYEIFVNGVLNYLNPTTNPYYHFGYSSLGGVTKSLCNNWQVGMNEVIVHVRSGQNPPPTWEGFLAQANQTVNTTVGVPFSANTTQTNVSCFGGSNGSASVSASGGSAGYTYTWLPSGGNSNIASVLTAGVYSVIVASGNCSTTKTLSITQPAPFALTTSPNATICNGTNVVLSAAGASTYSWSNGATGSSININSPGNYVVTGTSFGGCTNSKTITVTAGQSPTITVSGNNTICIGSSGVLTANGANSYTWNTGQQSNSITVSPSATTIYTVSGSSIGIACPSNQTVAVTVNVFLSLNISGLTSICSGNQTTLSVSGANTYTWNTGTQSSTINISPLSTSNFNVSGTNTLTGCTGSAAVTVTVNALPQIAVNNAFFCVGQSTVVTASGASTYTWNTGALTPSASVTSAGLYTVSATSSAGCLNTQTVNVTELSLPQITINGIASLCKGQAATLSASGASTYVWNTGALTPSLILPNVNASAIYSVAGTDNATGCTNTQTFALNVIPLPVINISGNSVTCDGASALLNANGADSYTWSTGQTTSQITVNPPGNNTYVASGTNTLTGCKNSAAITVTVSATPNLTVTGGITCAGQPFTLNALGASSYLWNTGALTSTAVVAPVANSVYTVTGYGTATLCNITKTVQVNVKAAPQLTLNTNYVSLCKGKSTVLSVSGGSTYVWSDGQTYSAIVITPPTTAIYSVSALEAGNGCISTKTILVKVNELPKIKITGDTTLCDGERIVLNASGGNSYQWNTLATSNSIEVTINENALYILNGTNTLTGCSNLDSIRLGNSEKCCELYIPNSFTPNEDAINESFGAVSLCDFTDFKMLIFDKWGEQIFSGNAINIKWNGSYKGVLCKQDVYVYLIRAKRAGSSGVKPFLEKTGHVSLIR